MVEREAVRVYSGPVLAMVTHLRQVLQMNGIASEVRGEYRGAGLGELPVTEAWPELWVRDPARGPEAMRLIQEALVDPASEPPEVECPACHEMVEVQFGQCWNCGAKMPESGGS